jgi:hypothetical protein
MYVLKGTMMRGGCIVLGTEIDGSLELSSAFLPFLVHCRTPAVGQFCETSDIKQEK